MTRRLMDWLIPRQAVEWGRRKDESYWEGYTDGGYLQRIDDERRHNPSVGRSLGALPRPEVPTMCTATVKVDRVVMRCEHSAGHDMPDEWGGVEMHSILDGKVAWGSLREDETE